MWFSPAHTDQQHNASDSLLTERQRQVIDLAVQGLPNKAIARQLSIAEHTVERHLDAAYRKLGVTNRTEAAFRLRG